jgi:hypothetical protein
VFERIDHHFEQIADRAELVGRQLIEQRVGLLAFLIEVDGHVITYGGEGGIRTHGTRKGSTVFETARFNHSRTSPRRANRIIAFAPAVLSAGNSGRLPPYAGFPFEKKRHKILAS